MYQGRGEKKECIGGRRYEERKRPTRLFTEERIRTKTEGRGERNHLSTNDIAKDCEQIVLRFKKGRNKTDLEPEKGLIRVYPKAISL